MAEAQTAGTILKDRPWALRDKISFAALVITAVSLVAGGITALVGGGAFFATFRSEFSGVADDVEEIKGDIKGLSVEIDRKFERMVEDINDLDGRVRVLERPGGDSHR